MVKWRGNLISSPHIERQNRTFQSPVEGELLKSHANIEGELLTSQVSVEGEHQTTNPLVKGEPSGTNHDDDDA